MTKAKQAVGLPVELEEDQVAITYYLLRPKEAELEPEPLVLGELNTVFLQKEWKVAKLNRKHQVGKYDRFGISSTQESRKTQEDWDVLRGEYL